MNCIQNKFPSRDLEIQSTGQIFPHGAKQAICQEVVSRCTLTWGDRIRAVILTGSLARNEATFVRQGDRHKLFGDADCFIVFQRATALPPDREIVPLQREIEDSLAQEGLTARVGLSCISPRFLKALPPIISTYELRNCGEVLWGDNEALSLVPNFFTQNLSREDAWRMLCNRMIELLAFVEDFSASNAELTPELHYATVKLFLDMATSYLVFAGQYAPSFRERSQRLLLLADNPPADAPFPLKKFASRVAESTAWKISSEEEDCDRRVELWHEAISYMRRLWRWEAVQLTGARGELTIGALCRLAAKQQNTGQRIRGWLSVARRRGMLKSWRHWPRWGRLGLSSTPRYLTYHAAAEVAFRLPCLVKHAGQPPRLDVDWRQIQSLLPERGPQRKSDNGIPWRELAGDVLWNYTEFLLSTRA